MTFGRFQYRSCTSFVKFISKHFIPFDSIVNEIVFLISFLDCLLLVYTIEMQLIFVY